MLPFTHAERPKWLPAEKTPANCRCLDDYESVLAIRPVASFWLSILGAYFARCSARFTFAPWNPRRASLAKRRRTRASFIFRIKC